MLLNILNSDIKMEKISKLQAVDAMGTGKGLSTKPFFLCYVFIGIYYYFSTDYKQKAPPACPHATSL